MFLPKSTEIAEVVPFTEEKEPRTDDAQTEVVNTDPNVSKNILSEEALKINHLKAATVQTSVGKTASD